jgi:hypothetical protein
VFYKKARGGLTLVDKLTVEPPDAIIFKALANIPSASSVLRGSQVRDLNL